jgi:hypothetical protein
VGVDLDGVDRKLDADDRHCDAAGPSALAGVMGGQRQAEFATTRRVLLGVRTSARVAFAGHQATWSSQVELSVRAGRHWVALP